MLLLLLVPGSLLLPLVARLTNVGGIGLGARAWQLLVTECQEPMTALEQGIIWTEFNNATIADTVGIDIGSIVSFNRELNKIVERLPAAARPSDTRRAEKILECISKEANNALALEAVKELQAQANRVHVVAGVPLPDNRDLTSLVRSFEQTWSNCIRHGIMQRNTTNVRRHDNQTALQAECQDTQHDVEALQLDDEQRDHCHVCDDEDTQHLADEEANYNGPHGHRQHSHHRRGWPSAPRGTSNRFSRAPMTRRPPFGSTANTPVQMQIVCTNCRGLGHKAADCPSAKQDRPLSTAITVLTRMHGTGTAHQQPYSPPASQSREQFRPVRRQDEFQQRGRSFTRQPARRMSFRSGAPQIRVLEEDDADSADEDTMLMMDVDQGGQGTKRSCDQPPSSATRSKTDDNDIPVRWMVKLLPYCPDADGNLDIYTYTRSNTQRDLFGADVQQHETVVEAMERCVHNSLGEMPQEWYDHLHFMREKPHGDYHFDARCEGVPTRVFVFCMALERIASPLNLDMMWPTMMEHSNTWINAETLLYTIFYSRRRLAQAVIDSLRAGGCHEDFIPADIQAYTPAESHALVLRYDPDTATEHHPSEQIEPLTASQILTLQTETELAIERSLHDAASQPGPAGDEAATVLISQLMEIDAAHHQHIESRDRYNLELAIHWSVQPAASGNGAATRTLSGALMDIEDLDQLMREWVDVDWRVARARWRWCAQQLGKRHRSYQGVYDLLSFGGKQYRPYGGGFIMWQGACVSWIARRLRFIPLSSCEAEIGALFIMLKEAMFVKAVLEDMGVKLVGPCPAFTDSSSGIDVVKNVGVTKHTIHVGRWLHWARDLYMAKWFSLTHVTTDKMMADDKTKVLDRAKFLKCRAFQINHHE